MQEGRLHAPAYNIRKEKRTEKGFPLTRKAKASPRYLSIPARNLMKIIDHHAAARPIPRQHHPFQVPARIYNTSYMPRISQLTFLHHDHPLNSQSPHSVTGFFKVHRYYAREEGFTYYQSFKNACEKVGEIWQCTRSGEPS
jgi:hypothetical protein